MRRGFTLIELLTSTSLLVVVFALALPLFFMGDRALSKHDQTLNRQAAAARLLGDLSRDLRSARAINTGARSAQIDSITYRYDPAAGTVTRHGATGYSTYNGVHFTLSPQGRLIRLTVHTGATELSALILRRIR